MDITSQKRFAAALQQARLNKHWKQEDLAKALHVSLRTVISWETGARLPSGGMVFLLCLVFTDRQETLDKLLQHELLVSYLIDDVERQTRLHSEVEFRHLVDQGTQGLLQFLEEQRQPEQARGAFPLPLEQTGKSGHRVAESRLEYGWQSGERESEASGDTLQQLFALFDQLRQHPELITVVSDFLREIVQQV